MSDRPPAEALYDLVVELLRRQGKGKTWLAQRSGVNRNTISNWQRQPRPPQPGSVLAVADALGIEHDRALRLAGLASPVPEDGAPFDLAAVDQMSNDELATLLHRIGDVLGKRAKT